MLFVLPPLPRAAIKFLSPAPQVPVPELVAILRVQRAQSTDPTYWDEVQAQLPPDGGLLDIAELAEVPAERPLV